MMGLAGSAVLVAGGVAFGGAGIASASGSKSTLVVGILSTFTGINAGDGQEAMAGCIPASTLINADGGVMGHKVTCQEFNTSSDPADAVPETHRMLALGNNLLVTMGSSGTTAPAVIPLVNAAKRTIFTECGLSLFNVNHYRFFWRNDPVDASQGYAMAIATVQSGYKRVAAVFGQDVSSQGSRPSFLKGMKQLGHPVVSSVLLPTNSPSYTAQIAAIQESKPQVIVGEITPSSSATFFSELKQVFGKVPPVIGDEAYDQGPWDKAVSGAIGSGTLSKALKVVVPVTASGGPGWNLWKKTLMASSDPTKKTFESDSYAGSDYDAVILSALAADEAHSLNAAKYNTLIMNIANGVPGAVVVHTYAEGIAALKKGRKIHYIGASGSAVHFNQYHNWEPGYVLDKYHANGLKKIRPISTTVLNALITGHHVKVSS
jgi:branched-chain amino acid transport system substrate-binding protein